MSADIKVTDGTILEALNNKVDIDFDNVASNSVSFARMSREVTNCITEIPQRIKYTLENGTLTIKAGSVVIVPYGVEDLTAQYPVGATFINDNFKVYDTQFADGKFFVWAELVNDSVNITSSDSSTSERLMFINLTQFKVNVFLYSGSGTTDYTGSLNYALYRTDQNIMKRYSSGSLTGDVYCLPTAKVTADGTYTIGSVDQVFNGMGYIGSIKWLDTGVVGLATNGKNADGSLNNIEWKRNSILLKDVGANKDAEYIDIYTVDGLWYSTLSYTVSNTEPTIKTNAYWWYNPSTNEHFRSNGTNWVKMNATVIGSFSKVDGSIVSFTTKQPFRAVDYNEVPHIIETYKNGTSWYRIYSDGWCEQGGRITVNSDSQGTITLLKSFRDILYSVFMTNISTIKTTNETKAGPIWVNTQAVNSFTYTNDTWEGEMVWEAKGYIA